MSRNQRIGAQHFGTMANSAKRIVAGGAISIVAASLGACSADISRLESPSYSLGETQSGPPRPSEPIRRNNAGAPLDRGEAWTDSGPRGPLPPVTADQQRPAPNFPPVASGVGPSRPFDAPKQKTAAVPAAPSKSLAVASGRTIDVQQGDTLYGISKRTGYPISALMEANNLKSPNLKPGQKLALPAGPAARKPMARATAPTAAPAATAPATPAAIPPVAAVHAPAAPAPTISTGNWNGTYTVKSGDSLYAVARAHKIPLAALQTHNGIADPTKVRPGTILKVPGDGAEATPAVAVAPVTPRIVQAQPVAAPVAAATGGPQPKIINAAPVAKPEQVAALGGTATDAAAAPIDPPVTQTPAKATPTPAASASAKFRWPARGNVLTSFGKRPDGTHNDGVNIAVPLGADVVAADGGTVAYAGNELKGYGNLVLIRHDNGWVSAYAHADQLLVKRGDAIKRGQVIAKAGKTGTVDQPQVHFELRQGSKPVDPLPHMEKQ